MDYDRLINQLKQHEGLKLTAYLCSSGRWTIGYGRNLDDRGLSPSEQIQIIGCRLKPEAVIEHLKKNPITAAQAEELLLNDIDLVEQQIGKFIDQYVINAPRQAALINMGFNLGIAGLLKFTRMLSAIQKQHWEDAAIEMLDSRWAQQVGYRAKELAEQMRTGEWV